MSDAMVSVLDALDDPRALQGIRDEVLEMDLAVKRHMDRGLTPDEWAVAQARPGSDAGCVAFYGQHGEVKGFLTKVSLP